MKQVVLQVEDCRYKFFMELIKNFDFITVSNEDKAKQQAVKKIAEGMLSAIRASKGEIKTRSAKSFLNEL